MTQFQSDRSKKKLGLLVWIIILILMTASAAHLLRTALRAEESTVILIATLVFAICVIFGLGRSPFQSQLSLRKFPYLPLSAIPVLLLAIWAANARLFGSFDVSAVLFHLEHSLDYDGVRDDIIEFIGYLIFGIIFIACVSYIARRDRRMVLIERIGAAALLLINPVTHYAYDRVINPQQNGLNLAEAYQTVSIRAEDTGPKNLILIYLESMEATFAEDEFGDVYDDLNALSDQGLRINGVGQAQDTGWTIAGMVASQCGVPLLSFGLVMKNRMKNIESFLPNADCLASQLSDRGYATRFYGGAPLNFAGKGKFLAVHGYDQSIGLDEIPKEDRREPGRWGFHDDQLYSLALAELGALSAADQPYLLSILTLGAHAPAGHPAPACFDMIDNAENMDTTLLSVACTARLTRNFLEMAESQGLLENTVVVLLSDHLAQKNTVTERLDQYSRENFVLILGADYPPTVTTKPGVIMDVYPTILEAIDLPAKAGKAGLGTSLLGTTPTLLEEHGLKALNRAIRSDKALREQLWDLEPQPVNAP